MRWLSPINFIKDTFIFVLGASAALQGVSAYSVPPKHAERCQNAVDVFYNGFGGCEHSLQDWMPTIGSIYTYDESSQVFYPVLNKKDKAEYCSRRHDEEFFFSRLELRERGDVKFALVVLCSRSDGSPIYYTMTNGEGGGDRSCPLSVSMSSQSARQQHAEL